MLRVQHVRYNNGLWVKKKKQKMCVAREPLLHGSKACDSPADANSDLCYGHSMVLYPHQLINGVLYIGDEDHE